MSTVLENKALLSAQKMADALEAEIYSLGVDKTILRLYGLWTVIARATGAKTRFDVVLDAVLPQPSDKVLADAVSTELARLRVR